MYQNGKKCLNLPKTAKCTQNSPKWPKNATLAKKIQILPKSQICFQNPFKYDQISEHLQKCQKCQICPKLPKLGKNGQMYQNGQKCLNLPKTAKCTQNSPK
jgi:hypothetical protein